MHHKLDFLLPAEAFKLAQAPPRPPGVTAAAGVTVTVLALLTVTRSCQ